MARIKAATGVISGPWARYNHHWVLASAQTRCLEELS